MGHVMAVMGPGQHGYRFPQQFIQHPVAQQVGAIGCLVKFPCHRCLQVVSNLWRIQMHMPALARMIDKGARIAQQQIAHMLAKRCLPFSDQIVKISATCLPGQPEKIMIIIAGKDFIRAIAIDQHLIARLGHGL